MRIGVMAAGAVGGYFGARMAAAGHDVFFIARGSNLQAIRSSGLRIESVHGDLHITEPNATDTPADVGPVDIVLFAVKLWDTESAAKQMRPMVGPGTRVIPLQNGINSPEILAQILGAEAVAPGSAYIAAVMAAPGVIEHTSQFARMTVGRSGGKPDPQLTRFADAAREAGIDIALSNDIDRDRWEKFVFLVGLSGATATIRLPLGPIREDADTRAFFHGLMEEVVAVGRGKGVAVPQDYADDRLKFGDASPPTFKASMLHDLERGNRLELDWLAGYVVRLGRELGIPTPRNQAVYDILKLYRMGPPLLVPPSAPQ